MQKQFPILSLVLVLISGTAARAQRDKLDVALGAAQHKEEVQGDLQGAIAAYKKVTADAGANRAVAAKAQLRLGLCYEKLGAADASRVYKELIARYADQRDVAGQAQARLNALGANLSATAASGMTVRLLWDNAHNMEGNVSTDGRWLSFIDWDGGGDVAIRDLVNGTSRRVNDAGDWPKSKFSVEMTTLSPDGKQIAYQWSDYRVAGRFDYAIRVVGADGKGDRTLYQPEGGDPAPYAWLPDGKRIAVVDYGKAKGKPTQLLLMNVSDGKFISRATINGGVQEVVFSPDGRWVAYSVTREAAWSGELFIASTGGSEAPRKLSAHPAGERLLGWSPDGGYVLILSERSGSPGAWLLPVADGNVTGEAVLVKSGLSSRIRPHGFTSTGAFVYGEGETLSRSLAAGFDPANGVLTGRLEPVNAARGNSSGGEWSRDGRKFFYRVQQRFVIRDWNTGFEYEVAPKMKSMGLYSTWNHDGTEILVFGTGQDEREGFYRVDPRTGDATLVVASGTHPNMARAAMSPDGKTVYYHTGNHQTVSARDLATGSERILQQDQGIVRSIGVSPDGKTVTLSLDQEIRLLDSQSGRVTRTIRTRGDTDRFEGSTWLPDGSGLLALWFDGGQGEGRNLVKIPLDGSAWTTAPLGMRTRGFHLSRDGKSVSVTQVTNKMQVWVMENFLPKQAASR